MAQPLVPEEMKPQSPRPNPRTVIGAKAVEIALVTYTDEAGQQFTQLAVVGDNNVHLIEGRVLGISRTATPQGVASDWLRDGVFKKLGRK